MKYLQISVVLIILLASACSPKRKSELSQQDITEQEINHVQNSLKDLNKLQQTINELEKNRTDIQSEFDKQKLEAEKLQKSLTEYKKELEKQKSFSAGKDKLIAEKNGEILELKQNIEDLKNLDSYNEHETLKSTEEKYQLLQKQMENLLNEQNELQENLEQIKNQNMLLANDAENWKTRYEDFEQNFNNRVKEEKRKLKSKYNEKLNKITEDIVSGKAAEYNKESYLKKGQQVGKIIEILNGKITFRLDDEKFSRQLKEGDKLFVVRSLAGNLVNIGTLEITNLSAFSAFGRATVDELKTGMNVYTEDYLVIKN